MDKTTFLIILGIVVPIFLIIVMLFLPLPIQYMEPYKYCEKFGYTWNQQDNECQILNEYTCKQSGGTFIEKGPTCSEYEHYLAEFSNRCLENYLLKDWTDTYCTSWDLTKIVCDELGGNTTRHNISCNLLDKESNYHVTSCDQKASGIYTSICKYD